MKQTKSKKVVKGNSIRVSHENKKWIDEILRTANKKERGRRIKLDDLLNVLRGKVSNDEVELMRSQSLTNEDRKEELRQKYIAVHGAISKDAFTGFMMTAEFHAFLSAQNEIGVVTRLNSESSTSAA